MTLPLPGLWAQRVCVRAVTSVSLARVPRRWVTAGGDVDQLNAGCLVWWMSQSGGLGEKHRWAEAMCCPQLSQWIRANILRRDQPCRNTLERRSASVPSQKLSGSLTCLSLSPFLRQPYKHWQLCSGGNECGVTDWLGAPHSFPRLRMATGGNETAAKRKEINSRFDAFSSSANYMLVTALFSPWLVEKGDEHVTYAVIKLLCRLWHSRGVRSDQVQCLLRKPVRVFPLLPGSAATDVCAA